MSVWYKLLQFIIRFLVLTFCRFRAFGPHHIPRLGGAIIAANHQSYLDPVLLGVGIRRPIHFMARQELFEVNYFFKWLIQSLNAFPLVRRSSRLGSRYKNRDSLRSRDGVYPPTIRWGTVASSDSSGMREAVTRLRQGSLLVVFPEGTRSFDGTIGDIKGGLYLLAKRANVPVIPALINGAFEVWSRHHRLPVRLSPIRVIYGSPLKINQFNKPVELAQRLHQELTHLILNLSREY